MSRPRCRPPVWTTVYTDWNQVPLFLSVKDVACLLNMQIGTIRRRVEDGTIKAQKIGKEWRISKESVMKFGQTGGENDV